MKNLTAFDPEGGPDGRDARRTLEELIALVRETDSIIFDEALVENVHEKGRADYVTKVDEGVQKFLQGELAGRYPRIGFIAEEQERFAADPKGAYWILDPIYGTTNLIHHYQMSAVSLGLYENGEMLLGVVYNPFSREVFSAAKGQGAFLNGERIRTAGTPDLAHALVSYGSSPYEKERAHGLFVLYERIFRQCSDFRRCGSAALDLCYVACGRQDVYLERNLKPWDYAAGGLIVTEAGGCISGWEKGRKVPWIENADVLAANGGAMLEGMLALL